MARQLTRSERIEHCIYENMIAGKSYLEQSRGYCEALIDGEMAIEVIDRLKVEQKKINEMHVLTREEAIKKFHEITYPETYDDVGVTLGSAFHRDRKWAEKAIAGFEALGLIKFKEPEEDAYALALDVNGDIQRVSLNSLRTSLESMGYQIVKF